MKIWLMMAVLGAGCVVEEAPGVERRPVINGTPTPEGMYPATGALILDGQAACTGTLIEPDVVLTAAHCVHDFLTNGSVPGFTLVHDARQVNPADVVPGIAAHAHEGFDLFGQPEPGVQQWHDIGLLVLAEPIPDVVPERLPSIAEADSTLVPGAEVEIVGYGVTEQVTFSYGVKTHGVATLVEVGAGELLIAEPGEQQNCNGDSGGPAYLELDDGSRRVFGVVSRSPDDDTNCDHGGIDTRVDVYLDWIDSKLGGGGGDAGPTDAGPEPDAGAPDAGDDAGIGGDEDDDDAGCGCRAGKSPDGGLGGLLLVLLVAARVRRGRS